MIMKYIKYYAPFKRYAWLIIDDKARHHWFKYKLDANNFFKIERGQYDYMEKGIKRYPD